MFRFAAKLAFVACVATAIAAIATTAQANLASTRTPVLNQRVLAYATGKFGKQVGNGECWTLAHDALAFAGARRPGQDGLRVYEFGRRVALSPAQIQPGDVLQFENITFKHTTATSWSTNSFPHHTAIVYRVSGTQITILQQNVNGDRHVQTGVIDLRDLQPGGSLTLFRPVAR
ncbi:MAG: hypothetical protein U0793_32125 [Gemmataceae bacterium]